jgi:hypothetical protein
MWHTRGGSKVGNAGRMGRGGRGLEMQCADSVGLLCNIHGYEKINDDTCVGWGEVERSRRSLCVE